MNQASRFPQTARYLGVNKNTLFELEEARDLLKTAAVDSMSHCNNAEIFFDGNIKRNVLLGRSFNSSATYQVVPINKLTEPMVHLGNNDFQVVQIVSIAMV
jgi:hypothetical protein